MAIRGVGKPLPWQSLRTLLVKVPSEPLQRSFLQSNSYVSGRLADNCTDKIKTQLPVISAHLILKALKMWAPAWPRLATDEIMSSPWATPHVRNWHGCAPASPPSQSSSGPGVVIGVAYHGKPCPQEACILHCSPPLVQILPYLSASAQ